MNDGNQVINARFQDCIFFRVCNNPKHNLRVHIEKLVEDEARIETTLYALIGILCRVEVGLFDNV